MKNSLISKQIYTIKNKSYSANISFPKTTKKPAINSENSNPKKENQKKENLEQEKLKQELATTNSFLQERVQEVNAIKIDLQQAKKKNNKLEKIIASQQREIEKIKYASEYKDLELKETIEKYKNFDIKIEKTLQIAKTEKHKRKLAEKNLAQAMRNLKKVKEYASKKSKTIHSLQIERQMTMHKVRHLVKEYYEQKLFDNK